MQWVSKWFKHFLHCTVYYRLFFYVYMIYRFVRNVTWPDSSTSVFWSCLFLFCSLLPEVFSMIYQNCSAFGLKFIYSTIIHYIFLLRIFVFQVHFGVNRSFNGLVWLGYKSHKHLLLFCKFSLKCCTYLCTFSCIFILLSGLTFGHLLPVFMWAQGYRTSWLFPEIPLNKNLIGQGAWFTVFANVHWMNILSLKRHHGVLFLHPSEAQQQLNEVQRFWGILRPGGFTLNSFFASVIHGACAKRLDNHDTVFWLYVVLSLYCVTWSNRFI